MPVTLPVALPVLPGDESTAIVPGVSDESIEPGIHYVCQRCGNCCRWPGEVKVSTDEVEAIADFLGMENDAVIQGHTRLRANRQGLALLDKSNGECEFLAGVDCRLQAVKPQQCRDFPNKWRFPGWREVCEAIPVPAKSVPVPATEIPPASE